MITSDRQTLSSFISESPWGKRLDRLDLERVLATTKERVVRKGDDVISAGSPAHHWVGLIHGFAVQSVAQADGHVTFLSAVSDGAWFGEGTLLKRARWGYDAVALRETRVALVPLPTFERLRETSVPFNHFLQTLMNARLGNFIELLLSARYASTEGRVATALANLFNTDLYLRSRFVRISQAELAMLAGTSRQRANDALKTLQELGLVVRRRQGIEVIDLERLKAVASSPHQAFVDPSLGVPQGNSPSADTPLSRPG